MNEGSIGRVDHLVLAAPELESGIEHARRLLSVTATSGGRHPAWGTTNALIALGPETYLEIVGPDPDRDVAGMPSLFGIDRLEGPTLVTWAARASHLEEVVLAAAGRGLALGDVQDGGRAMPDGSMLAWRLTDPFAGRAGGVVPFLIDWGTTPHPAGTAAPGCRLIELRGEHPDAGRLRERLAALDLALPLTKGDRPRLIATVDSPMGVVELA